jgi:hypothetical protein
VINRRDSRLDCHLRCFLSGSEEIRNRKISCSVYSISGFQEV